MTKKDYERIAKALAAAKPERGVSWTSAPFQVWIKGVDMLVDELTLDNPRFDRDRFYAACGV